MSAHASIVHRPRRFTHQFKSSTKSSVPLVQVPRSSRHTSNRTPTQLLRAVAFTPRPHPLITRSNLSNSTALLPLLLSSDPPSARLAVLYYLFAHLFNLLLHSPCPTKSALPPTTFVLPMVEEQPPRRAMLCVLLPIVTSATPRMPTITRARDDPRAASAPIPRLVRQNEISTTMTTTPNEHRVAPPSATQPLTNLQLDAAACLSAKSKALAQLLRRVPPTVEASIPPCRPPRRPERLASVICEQPTERHPGWARARPTSLLSIP